MNSPCPFAVGDQLKRRDSSALAQRIRVTAVSVDGYAQDFFKADVLEGENTKDPLKVFRAGWFLYEKVLVPGTEEGLICNREGCCGTMGFGPVVNCSCHNNPPCSACVDNPLVCLVCGANPDEDEKP